MKYKILRIARNTRPRPPLVWKQTPSELSNNTPFGMAQNMEYAFSQIGGSMMSDDFAAKLLAYCLVMGGGNESVTHHKGLNAGLGIASQKAGLKGGCIPNMKIVALFQQYNKELERDMEATPWLQEIYERYNLTPTGAGKKEAVKKKKKK